MRAPRLTWLVAVASTAAGSSVVRAHTGPRIWIGSTAGEIVTLKGNNDSAPTTYTPQRVFIGGMDEDTLQANGRLDEYPFPGTDFYATDFPGYQVRTDGQAGFSTGKTFGFELAGPLLVFDPATQLFASVRKQYGTPGPAPQMRLDTSTASTTTGLAPAAGSPIFPYNAAGDHGHFTSVLLGDGATATDGPHAIYALPLRLSGTGLARSKPYYVLLGRDLGYLPGDPGRTQFLAAEQVANQTLANVNDWPGQWWANAGGNWSDASKWMPDVADQPALPAQFLSRITSPQSIIVNGAFSVGTLVFDNANRYTLSAGSGSSGLTLNRSDGTNLIRVASGSHTIATPLTFALDGNLDVASGSTLTITSDLAATGRAITKTGGGTVELKNVRAASLGVSSGTVAILPTGGAATGTSRVTSLSIAAGARLDLGDNKLIVASGDLAQLAQRIRDGFHDGAWDGDGLVTSRPDALAGLTSLGIASADQAGYAGGTFGGLIVAAGDVLVMYTYAGDANLDGFISGDDYASIDGTVSVPGASGWYNGDFNHDGIISGDDYAAIDSNIIAQGAPFPTAAGGSLTSPSSATAVPEPATILTMAGGVVTAAMRRRRRISLVCGDLCGGRQAAAAPPAADDL